MGVEAALYPENWTNVVESAQAATLQIPVADLAAMTEKSREVTVTNCVPGFYYSLYDGFEVTNVTLDANNRDVICGKEETVTFPAVKKPSDAAGFFSIGVLTVPTVYVTGENSSPTGIPPYLPGHPPVRH